MIRVGTLATAVLLVVAACGGSVEPTAVAEQPANLTGTEWVVTTLFGADTIAGTTITLQFGDERLEGFAGCNGYSAPYSATAEGSLKVIEVAMTEVDCPEPQGVLTQEGVLEQALLAAARYELGFGTLALVDESGRTIMETEKPGLVAEPTEAPAPVTSPLWVAAADVRTGLQFAVPCFWEVNVPTGEQDPTGLGSFFVRNYDDAFVQAHPRGAISEEEGAVKIDFSYIAPSQLGLTPGANLNDFAQTLAGPPGESGIEATEPLVINGHEALVVTQQAAYGTGYFAVIALEDDLYLVYGSGAFHSEDVQGVLNSIAYSPEASIMYPSFDPAGAPLGVEARCIGDQSVSTAPDLSGALNCDGVAEGSAEILVCNVQAALLARDLEALKSYMADPFTIAYWGSQGGWASPEHMIQEFDNARLPQDTSGITFTTDRALFPPLTGIPPEQLFGPEVDPALLIYSEGWGLDGLGATIIYIAEDPSGGFSWSNLVYSHGHFDR